MTLATPDAGAWPASPPTQTTARAPRAGGDRQRRGARTAAARSSPPGRRRRASSTTTAAWHRRTVAKTLGAPRDADSSPASTPSRIGRASMMLGAGRERLDTPIDYGAGILLRAPVGLEVAEGQSLAELCIGRHARLEEARALAASAFVIGDAPPPPGPLVARRRRVGGRGSAAPRPAQSDPRCSTTAPCVCRGRRRPVAGRARLRARGHGRQSCAGGRRGDVLPAGGSPRAPRTCAPSTSGRSPGASALQLAARRCSS